MDLKNCSAIFANNIRCGRSTSGTLCQAHRRQKSLNKVFTPINEQRPRNLNGKELAEWFLSHRTRAEEDCLLWTGSLSSGYANGSANGKKILVHLFIAETLVQGSALRRNQQVIKICPNKSCINPNHLKINQRKRQKAKRRSHEEWLQFLHTNNLEKRLPKAFKIPDKLVGDSSLPILRDCGHVKSVCLRLINARTLERCQPCSASEYYNSEYWKNKLDKSNIILAPNEALPATLNKDTRITILGLCNHPRSFTLQAALLQKKPQLCHYCANGHADEWLRRIKENGIPIESSLPEKFNGKTIIKVRRKCGCSVEIPLATAVNNPESYCSKCRGRKGASNRSKGEIEVANFLLANGIEIKQNYREFGFELDIFASDLNLAIEYNGDYWHSNKFLLPKYGFTSKEYHLNKIANCLEKNVNLAFVWESDWKKMNQEICDALKDFVESKGALISPLLQKLESRIDSNK